MQVPQGPQRCEQDPAHTPDLIGIDIDIDITGKPPRCTLMMDPSIEVLYSQLACQATGITWAAGSEFRGGTKMSIEGTKGLPGLTASAQPESPAVAGKMSTAHYSSYGWYVASICFVIYAHG